ncbi:hypothetical protein [Kistimonas asteriae]|uniref:hypothetical protein n=1 Tax=Kistimonas asteriae TaxID=517724 RepID=UPI001BA7C53B|nr:hypothetical protein [Kistimonas asteriae]
MIESLSVRESLELALLGRRSPFTSQLHPLDTADTQRIEEVQNLIRLKIGIRLLQQTELLLVDTPSVDITNEGSFRTASLLKTITGVGTYPVTSSN